MKKLKILLTLLAFTGVCSLTVYATVFDREAAAVPAKAEQICFSSIKGTALSITAEELESRLSIAKGTLLGLTMTRLPDAAVAAIYVGDKPVQAYTPLTREEVDTLKIAPCDEAATVEFGFIPNCMAAGKNETLVAVNVLESTNLAPTAESHKLYTQKNVDCMGKITVYDPEGDLVKLEVTQRPEKGMLTFDGFCYTYEPYPDKTGADRFTFICRDKYGNMSKESFVDIEIEQDKDGFRYADMGTNPSHYSAIKLSEKGILTGERVGSSYFFHPSDPVTRGELLVLLLTASGLENKLSPTVNTGLTNDIAIPMYLKPYIALAKQERIILEDGFTTGEVPVRAEAVIMVKRATKLATVEEYPLASSDAAEIPSWAIGSYRTLGAYKMLDLYDNRAQPMKPLTRDTCADLIWQLWKYWDANKK